MELKERHWPQGGASCASCGVHMDVEAAHMSHVQPAALGHTSEPLNPTWLCTKCNMLLGMSKAADVLSSVSNISGFTAKLWLKLFAKSPVITASTTLLMGFVFTAAAIFSDTNQVIPKKSSYQEQIQNLDQTQNSLDQLSRFVDQQRASITSDQTAIIRLKNEQARLRPLVDADRKTVNALLAEQQARSDASQVRERWIGAAIGIAGGILVSAAAKIGAVLLRFFAKRRKEQDA